MSAAFVGAVAAVVLAGAAGDAADLGVPAEIVPGISGVSPSSGRAGTALTINGSGLSGASRVKVNGMTVAFSVVSDSELATTVPNGAATGSVVVTMPSWTATSATPFAVTASVTAIVPTSGLAGDLVRISGVGFDTAGSVKFNGKAASFTVLTPGALTANVPEGATTGPITVANAAGKARSVAKFTVLPSPPPSSATLLLNEIAPNLTNSTDLIELITTIAGSTSTMTVRQDPTGSPIVLATLPNASVAAGDLVVVHQNPPPGVTSETTSKTTCTDPACYPGAWDVAGGTAGITWSNRVLSVHSSAGAMLDAVPFARPSLPSPPAGFPAELQAIQAAGLWLPADCGGAPCTYTSTPTAQAVSVDWSAAINSSTSVARAPGAETNSKNDWTAGAPSFGAANP